MIWLRSIQSHFQIQIRMKKETCSNVCVAAEMFVLPSLVIFVKGAYFDFVLDRWYNIQCCFG